MPAVNPGGGFSIFFQQAQNTAEEEALTGYQACVESQATRLGKAERMIPCLPKLV